MRMRPPRVAAREASLTKPPRSLGRLEEAVAWLARWQGASPPRLETVEILVFAGNHGVTAQGVSAYPAAVTAQMVANFAAGGAAINQLARVGGAELRVVALDLDGRPSISRRRPPWTRRSSSTRSPPVTTRSRPTPTSSSWARWASATRPRQQRSRRLCSAAAARASPVAAPASMMAGLKRKQAAIDAGLERHRDALHDPLRIAAALGGRELAAILGATLAARRARIPVLIDGFVSTAAVAPLKKLRADALDHALAGTHVGRSRPSPPAAGAWP